MLCDSVVLRLVRCMNDECDQESVDGDAGGVSEYKECWKSAAGEGINEEKHQGNFSFFLVL